jgi:hypothetical protein
MLDRPERAPSGVESGAEFANVLDSRPPYQRLPRLQRVFEVAPDGIRETAKVLRFEGELPPQRLGSGEPRNRSGRLTAPRQPTNQARTSSASRQRDRACRKSLYFALQFELSSAEWSAADSDLLHYSSNRLYGVIASGNRTQQVFRRW